MVTPSRSRSKDVVDAGSVPKRRQLMNMPCPDWAGMAMTPRDSGSICDCGVTWACDAKEKRHAIIDKIKL